MIPPVNLRKDLPDCSCDPNETRQAMIQLDCMYPWSDSQMTGHVSSGDIPGKKFDSEPNLKARKANCMGKPLIDYWR